MSKILVTSGVIVAGAFIWWFVAGSSFVALVDHLTTAPIDSITPSDFAFDEGNAETLETPKLTIGDRSRAASAWRVVDRPSGHLSLETSSGTFDFGMLTRRESRGGERSRYEFLPDPGDVVSLTRRESRVSWPRPFVINWLGGPRAVWTRHVYFRLVWRKPSGDVLDVRWRDDKRFEKGNGWYDLYGSAEPVTRLTSHEVH